MQKEMQEGLFGHLDMRGVALPDTATVGEALARNPNTKSDFTYGWCKTDHKDGRHIRKDFRSTDYVFDEPHATSVRQMLETMGLPMPEKQQVFRGTNHDLLFINSHGVVLRIGPTNVEDLIAPGILQPLGWLEDSANTIYKTRRGAPVPLAIVIYPGVELCPNMSLNPLGGNPEYAVADILKQSEQSSDDLCSQNMGRVRLKNALGVERPVPMMIDSDNKYNAPTNKMASRREAQFDVLRDAAHAAGLGLDTVILNTLTSVYNHVSSRWHRVFEVHQPLRHLFWRAFEDKHISTVFDPVKRQTFWQACKAATQAGLSMEYPVWRSKQNPDGSLSFEREVIKASVGLYRSWTGMPTESPGFLNSIKKALVRHLKPETAKADIALTLRPTPPR